MVKGMQSELEAGARGRAGSEQGIVPECPWRESAEIGLLGGERGVMGVIPGSMPPEESKEVRMEHCLGEACGVQ